MKIAVLGAGAWGTALAAHATSQHSVSLWSRNLFNEQHLFYRAGFAYRSTGPTGIYNESRTYGIDAPVKF